MLQAVPGAPAVSTVPTVSAVPVIPVMGKCKTSIVEIIILVVVSVVAVTAISFAVYFYLQWGEAQTNLDGRIAEAEAIAREDQQRIADAVFAEELKLPNRRFTGPMDYGSVSFLFPKTWSVFIESDASQGGDFEAFLNPEQVNQLRYGAIHALRVSIKNQPIDVVRQTYDGMVTSGQLRQSVFQNETITGDRFEGALEVNIVGIMIMFKVNDKTAIIRTDAMIFKEDFDKLIAGITLH